MMPSPHKRTALVALVGGDEFTSRSDGLDRELLRLAAGTPPNVAILPTAAEPENPQLAAAHGIDHFRKLGADAYAVMVLDQRSANDQGLVDELRKANLIYLTGGSPTHLLASLKDSLAWSRIAQLVQSGVLIVGSSAGAMALCEHITFGGQRLEGLGLIPGVAVLPHFEGGPDERLHELRAGVPEGVTLLGIDGATGCLWQGDEWRVAGVGRVHVITLVGIAVVASGETFDLR